jgi:hypothetical protein
MPKLEAAGSSTTLVPIGHTTWWLFLPVITIPTITTSSCSIQMTITVCVSPLLLPSSYIFWTQEQFNPARYIVQIFPLVRLLAGLVSPKHFHPEDAAHYSKTSSNNQLQIVPNPNPHNTINTISCCLLNIRTFTKIQVFWEHSETAEQYFAEPQILHNTPPPPPQITEIRCKHEKHKKHGTYG